MNYIKIKLSKRDVESIERNLKLLLNIVPAGQVSALSIAVWKRTLEMFRKRVKNGIKEKKPYKREAVYKK